MLSHHPNPYLAFVVVFLFCATNDSQTPTPPEDAPLKVKTVLLNVPVIVSDKEGRAIAGLSKENFKVTANGEPQTIEYLTDVAAPMNVAILMDTSGSARNVLGDIKRAARDFVSVFAPTDKAMVIGADSEIRMLQALTSDQKKIRQGINGAFISQEPGSDMLDAIYQVITKDFAKVEGRKAIIVLSDGFVGGRIFRDSLIDVLIESDVLIYPVYYHTTPILPTKVKTITLAELVKGPPVDYLNQMAVVTGGRFMAADGTDFKTVFQNISSELKKQYILGFYPTDSATTTTNKIKIELDRDGAVVRTKLTIRPKQPTSDRAKPRFLPKSN